MALEEVSFYNIQGEEINISNLVNQMINYYQQKLEVGETAVTDFNDGSEIRNLLEAFAVLCFSIKEDENEAGKLPFINLSYGTYLDRIGENPFIDLPRIQGSNSRGEVTFTLSTAQASDVVIPAGVLLEDSNGLGFVTLADCTIDAGETTGSVDVECLTNGYDGNVGSGTVTVISDDSIDTTLISVSNSEAFTGGADYEDDETYRERLLSNVQADGFGTMGYYLNLGESVDGVHDVKLINDITYTRKVLVNGFTKPTPDSVLLDVLTEFSTPENIVLGHSFTVDKPEYVTVALTISLNMLTSWSSSDLTSFVTKVVNGGSFEQMVFDGLNIGEQLTRDLLLDAFGLLDDVSEVTSIKVTGQSSEFSTTSISVNQVVKLGTLNFNQTVVG